ncbi:MAG: class I SAM-dependent methyltransferase [Rubrivivax sp.]|nr:class I SAM-dependent methyltransferase [Rubrivivax sp.]
MDQPPTNPKSETDAVRERYARREVPAGRYSLLDPAALRERQARQRALARMLVVQGHGNVEALLLTEVGCGHGGNLLELLQMGFAPEHLQGIELLPERLAAARHMLPEAATLWLGDACEAPVPPRSRQLVLAATVFSSLLDDAFQQRLADAMWQWLVPGGAVIWYDFSVDNPRNRDVRGVPLARVRELFPQARISASRLTLAPPLARAVCRLHPALYGVFNALPVLRTHLLAWIAKPDEPE